MKLLLIPLLAWFIAQSIKFIVRLFSKNIPRDLKRAFWTYVWAGGAPSAHTAILISTLYLIWLEYGYSPIFTFCLVVAFIFLYNLATDRKRQEVLNAYYETDQDVALKKIVKEGLMLDLAGHTVREIFWGALVGAAVAVSLTGIFNYA